jgi:hypothetical protein
MIDLDNFWIKDRDHIPLNSSIPEEQEFTVEFEFVVYWSFKWMMEKSLIMQVNHLIF